MKTMTRSQVRDIVRTVLLNDTSRFYTRQEVLEEANAFITGFEGEQALLTLNQVSQAFLDLVFDDDVADTTSDGRIRINENKLARWVVANG